MKNQNVYRKRLTKNEMHSIFIIYCIHITDIQFQNLFHINILKDDEMFDEFMLYLRYQI